MNKTKQNQKYNYSLGEEDWKNGNILHWAEKGKQETCLLKSITGCHWDYYITKTFKYPEECASYVST